MCVCVCLCQLYASIYVRCSRLKSSEFVAALFFPITSEFALVIDLHTSANELLYKFIMPSDCKCDRDNGNSYVVPVLVACIYGCVCVCLYATINSNRSNGRCNFPHVSRHIGTSSETPNIDCIPSGHLANELLTERFE